MLLRFAIVPGLPICIDNASSISWTSAFALTGSPAMWIVSTAHGRHARGRHACPRHGRHARIVMLVLGMVVATVVMLVLGMVAATVVVMLVLGMVVVTVVVMLSSAWSS